MTPRKPRARTTGRGLLAAWLVLGLLGCGDPARHKVGKLRGSSSSNVTRENPPATAGTGAYDPGPGPNGNAGSGSSMPTAGNASAGQGAPELPGTGGISGSICFPATVPAERKRLDLYLMVDINITLPLSGAWSTLTGGLREYVGSERAEGTGVGIDFFGVLPPVTNLDCSPDLYEMPTVGVGLLPGNTPAIQTAVNRALPLQGSPLQPALEGALAYARSRAGFYDEEAQQAVVLITDGFVDLSCGTNVRDVSNAAAVEMRRSPPVPTYVVALDVPSLSGLFDPLVRFEPLEAIAREGGTGLARRVNVEDRSVAIADTLLEVQQAAEPCDYFLPEQASAVGSTLSLAVSTDAANPEPKPLALLASENDCGDGYYMREDAPQITLCPATCVSTKARAQKLAWTIDCAPLP